MEDNKQSTPQFETLSSLYDETEVEVEGVIESDESYEAAQAMNESLRRERERESESSRKVISIEEIKEVSQEDYEKIKLQVSRPASAEVSTQNQYMPVPVEAAQLISEQFNKHVVVILSYDAAFNQLHVTTFGSEAQAKDIAAMWGEACAKLVFNADVKDPKFYEDYRASDAAQVKEANDKLVRENRKLAGEYRRAINALALMRGMNRELRMLLAKAKIDTQGL